MKVKFITIINVLFFASIIQLEANNGYASVYTEKINDPLAVYFTPDQFEIITDGSRDVSDALQAAINKVQATVRNGILFIPEGTYRISKTIYLWRGSIAFFRILTFI